jgi:CheY-like chemotaxis protein
MSDAPTWKDLGRTGIFLLAFALLGIAVLVLACSGNRAVPIVVALAAGAIAGVFGFLFAVPRVSQTANHESPEAGKPAPTSAAYQMRINTNLEEISDWLTKIIVGIGLSQLWNIPSIVHRSATFLAPAFGPSAPQNVVLALCTITYFTSVGGFCGYLLTRIYLAGAFRRADAHVVSGYEMTSAEVNEQQSRMIVDLQNQLIDLKGGNIDNSDEPKFALDERIAAGPPKDRVSSLLWVDDNPRDNVLMAERLRDINIEVVYAFSTQEAMKLLARRNFDRIISNMARTEEGKLNPTAGLDLLLKLREASIRILVAIFCQVEEVGSYHDVAMRDGAAVVTSSPLTLLNALQLEGN